MANPYASLLKTIQNTEKAKTTGEQFVADLNRSIQLGKQSHVPSKTVKPSGLGGCLREQWLILLGYPMDAGMLEKAEDITIQQSGNDRHNRLQNACQDACNHGVDIIWLDPAEEATLAYNQGIKTIIKRRDGNELLCYNETYEASFKCDGIIKYKGIKYILEIKTEEYGKFNCRVAPEPKHEFQAGMYCLCFGIDRVMFLYEDRNLTFRKGYELKVTDDIKKTVSDRIFTVLGYRDANIAPPKEKKCTYCHHKQECKKLGETQAYTLDELRAMKESKKEEETNHEQ